MPICTGESFLCRKASVSELKYWTGVECVREVRRIGMRTFVVGVTGNALITDQQEYLDAGADIILTKPALERYYALLTRRETFFEG